MRGISLSLSVFLVVLLSLSASAQTSSRELTLPGHLKLGATLEYPRKPGQYPGFVFLHGSGPSDRDGTTAIGAFGIKPYKHFCKDLAKQGAVVLRYDKRTYSLTQNADKEFAKTILPTNFIDDCIAAVKLLKDQPEVDPERIYLVAHSQGGMLAPWVYDSREIELAGVILLGPQLLPLRELIPYQLKYQEEHLQKRNYFGILDEQIAANRELNQRFIELFQSIDSGRAKPGEIIGGATPEFYIEADSFGRISVEAISKIDLPVLIINGTEDLKCPAKLLKSKEPILKKNKKISIVYREHFTHELYRTGYQVFDAGVPKIVYEWVTNGHKNPNK